MSAETIQQRVQQQYGKQAAHYSVSQVHASGYHFASMHRFLAESVRVLKANGRLLIADTSAPDDADADRWENEVELLRDPSHVRDYTLAEWRLFVEAAGFVEVEAAERSRTHLTFNDWVTRSGTPAETVARLRQLYDSASLAAVSAFGIRADGDDFAWSWPVAVVTGRKPA